MKSRMLYLLPVNLLLFLVVHQGFSKSIDFKAITSNKMVVNTVNTTETALPNTNNFATVSTEELEETLSAEIPTKTNLSENSFKLIIPFASISSQNSDFLFFTMGMFYGFIVLLILMNILNIFIFNERLFAKFSVWLVAFATLMFLGEKDASVVTGASVSALYLVAYLLCFGSYMIFANSYLPISNKFSKSNYLLFGILTVCASLTTSAIIGNSVALAQVTIVTLFVGSLFYTVAAFAFIKKTYVKLFFTVGMLLPIFGIDQFLFQNLNIQAFGFETGTIVKWAAVLQMLGFTYAIIYRMNVLKKAAENKNDGLKVFLKNQEVMNREKITAMMDDIYLESIIMHYDLNGLEIKLLQYISEGKSNEKIAQKLNITTKRVVEYTNELYEKLEIQEQVKNDQVLVSSQPDYLYN